MQKSVLEKRCGGFEEHFERQIYASECASPHKAPKIQLSDAGADVWKVVLEWTATGEMLNSYDARRPSALLVRCWNLGEKYHAPEFQDAAMLRLLQDVGEDRMLWEPIYAEEVREAFQGSKSEWSEMKELVAEELVKSLYHHDASNALLDMGVCDQISGLLKAVVDIHKRFMANPESFFSRFTKRKSNEKARWEHFMVDGGLNVAWNREADGDGLDEVKGSGWWKGAKMQA